MRMVALMLLVLSLSATETVSFLGDSLTAGYGIRADEAYPAAIQRMLAEDELDWRVVNAGVSGDTSRGGLERLDWVLRADPSVVVLALGGNDGLRGLPLPRLKRNLAVIIERLQEAEVRVVLCGMRLPSNYLDEEEGDYGERFHALYDELADEHRVPYYAFLLEGVAGRDRLNLADRIHPNAAGHRAVARRFYRFLKPLLTGEDEAGAQDGARDDSGPPVDDAGQAGDTSPAKTDASEEPAEQEPAGSAAGVEAEDE